MAEIVKLTNTTVKQVINEWLTEKHPELAEQHYVAELVYRPSGGWLLVLEPRSLTTSPTL